MNKIRYMILIVIMIPLCLPCRAQDGATEEYGRMVYASKEDRELVFSLLESNAPLPSEECTNVTEQWHSSVCKVIEENSLTVVEESLTPVLSINLLDYSQTGSLSLRAYRSSEKYDFYFIDIPKKSPYEYQYTAKLLTSDRQYAGNLTISVIDGKAYYKHAQLKGDGGSVSKSYADHAERIKKILELDDIVPASNVRYVDVIYLGTFFYVQSEKGDYLINIGREPKKAFADKFEDVVIDAGEALKNISDRHYNVYAPQIEQSIRELGEESHIAGNVIGIPDSGITYQNSVCRDTQNINNIFEYLGIDQADNGAIDPNLLYAVYPGKYPDPAPPPEKSFDPEESKDGIDNRVYYGIAIAIVLLIATVGAIIVYRKIKSENDTDWMYN